MKSNKDWVYLIVLFLLVFVLKYNILVRPIHWDALFYVLPSSLWFVEHSFLSIAQPDFGHPPLLFWILGMLFRLGADRLIAHLVIVVFATGGMCYTYLLGKHLFNRKVGMMASLLLLFSPLYFAQSGILNTDMPATALGIMAIYYAFRHRFWAYFASAGALLLTKETGIFVVLALIPYYLIKRYKTISILKQLSPLLVMIAWLGYYWLLSPSVFYPQHVEWLTTWLVRPELVIDKLLIWSNLLFISNFKFILTGLIIYNAIRYRRHLPHLYLVAAVLILIQLVFYSVYDQSLARHMLPLFPLVMIVGAHSAYKLLKNIAFVITGIMTLLFVFSWTGDRNVACGCELETNMEYLDMLQTHKDAAQYIETNYPDATVLANWPMVYELTEPRAGYVSKPVEAVMPENNYFRRHGFEHYSGDIDLIIRSPQSHVGLQDDVQRILDAHETTLLKKFEKNGKIAEVYKVD